MWKKTKEMKWKTAKLLWGDLFYDIAGAVLFAAGVYTFAGNADFAPGGITGISLLLNHVFGIPVGTLTLFINLPLIVISYRTLGKRFLLKTAKSMVITTFFLDVVFPVFPMYEGQRMMAALCSGALMGAGMVMFYMRGSSSGGLDFVIMPIKKKRPHLSVGKITMIIDLGIILLGWPVFGDVDAALYGLVSTFASVVVIDKVLYEEQEKSNEEKLEDVLQRVKGIDLNPIAVLTARVNYFINISHLICDNRPIDIPVYLGDSSYVPKTIEYDNVQCIDYVISTTKEPIEVTLPKSIVNDISKFSQEMIVVESQVKNQNEDAVADIFKALVSESDLTPKVCMKIVQLSRNLIGLEKKNWNGIWARILSNYLATANLGKFDVIVGNPPWVDWKSLPSGYRERIKSLCISRRLFSGDRLTGGINLNICALIANVAADNWLSEKGILGFLMPEPLVFQQSYEGFRNFYLEDGSRMYFCKFTNWTKSGNPFKPVTQKFLSFFLSKEFVDYTEGVETDWYIKKATKNIDGVEELELEEYFEHEVKLLACCHENKNFFSSVDTKELLHEFKKVGGVSNYIGREGIEFYPQELMVFKLSDLKGTDNCTCLRNIQNKKSKYKVPEFDVLLETEFLHPMIKGKDITPFHVECGEYIVPFPYEKENPRVPISMKNLSKKAPRLANYYIENKKMILEQTGYNERIIGRENAEFYALARVGEYSYAQNYVVFRDNTKWAAAVISDVNTSWGGMKRPLFQNHAVSICEDNNGNYITLDEAYYICGIMNTEIVYKYMMQSSDSRSFPIRPRIYIPKYDEYNKIHRSIVRLSKQAHEVYNNTEKMKIIVQEMNDLYKYLLEAK